MVERAHFRHLKAKPEYALLVKASVEARQLEMCVEAQTRILSEKEQKMVGYESA